MLIGEEIPATYSAEDDLLMPGLLKGSFVFLADLVRRTYWPLWVDFLVSSSYGTTVPGRPLAVTCASSYCEPMSSREGRIRPPAGRLENG